MDPHNQKGERISTQTQVLASTVLLAMTGNAADFKYAAELIENASKLCAAGKGLLAADESTGTIGKRVSSDQYMIVRTIIPMGFRSAELLTLHLSSGYEPSSDHECRIRACTCDANTHLLYMHVLILLEISHSLEY